jgi:hypothetical protein
MFQPIFASEVIWAAQPGIVAVSSSPEYSISVIEAGRLTRIVRRDVDPIAASRELAIRHLGDSYKDENPCRIDPAEMVDNRGYAGTIPLIGTVFLSPSGEVWVQRFMVDRDATAPFDVFDARGAYVGTLVRDSFSPVVLLPGGRVGVVETDELDVQRLVVFSIQR